MSRPIAYNTSFPLSGSITTQQGGGLISYTIDGTGRDYSSFAGKKWVPSADGAAPIIFVTDSFTQGISTAANAVPLFYGCAGTSSAAILYTANRLPGSPGNYATVNDAIIDLLSNDWFIIEGEQPFEGVNADKMVLDLDPSKLISYPGTGTVWYDISGKNNPSNLTNSPTFNSGGWFEFDGIDDYSVGQGGLVGPDCTIELWISSSNYNGKIPLSIDGNGYASGPNLYFTSNVITWNTGDGAGNPFANSSYPDTKWHHIMVSNDYTGAAGFGQAALYIDGDFVGFANPLVATATQSANRFWIGRFHGGSYFTSGKFKAARIYDEAFTEARIKQNYFGSNIVTDGLIFAVDANNIVSYPKSGTSWYNLTGSVASGTLNNGPTFNPSNGGSIVFDGTDDYVNVPNGMNALVGTNQVTFSAWIRRSSTPSYWAGIISNKINLAEGIALLVNPSSKIFFQYDSTSGVYAIDGGATLETNVWYNIVGIYDNVGLKTYLNGILNDSADDAGKSIASSGNMDIVIGAHQPVSSYFPGEIANVKIYSRGLTAAEVLQNYQAEQYRFAGPQGIVTNGLVLNFDASNLDSYPGTGTTWYTLAGSDNGTLINGPSFSTEAGGCIVFDGVDDYVSFGNPLDQAQLSQVWTVQAWINITTKPPQLLVGGLAVGQYIEFVQGNNSLLYLNSGANDYYTYGGQFTAQGWVLATFRFNNATGDRQILRNLSNISTGGPNNTFTPGGQASTFTIGSNSSDTILGKVGNVLFYNRYLSDAELTQNYNATKGRFGL